MQKQYRISAGQLFSILFVNQSVIMLTHNTLLGGGENMVDNILSALLALVLNFVLILPLYFLHRRNPQENVLETGERLVGKPGAILLAVFYGLYFMAIDSYYLSFFQIFLNNIMEPLMPVWLVALAFVAVVCYACLLYTSIITPEWSRSQNSPLPLTQAAIRVILRRSPPTMICRSNSI